MSKVVCKDITGATYEVEVDQLKWRPAAYGIVFKNDAVLLSPQFDPGMYDLPGGGLDVGELPEEALIREVKEETGLLVHKPQLIACESDYFTFRRQKGVYYQTLGLYYLCDLEGGTLSTDGFDEFEQNYARLAEWVPMKELARIKIANSKDFRPHILKAYEMSK